MRQIYKVFATQVVVSDSHPEGMLSDVSGYPKSFDSRSYKYNAETNPNGDEEIALLAAQAEYSNEIVTLATAENANRVGWVVSIIRTSDGKEIARKPWGGYPDLTPPEPEPQPEGEGEGE